MTKRVLFLQHSPSCIPQSSFICVAVLGSFKWRSFHLIGWKSQLKIWRYYHCDTGALTSLFFFLLLVSIWYKENREDDLPVQTYIPAQKPLKTSTCELVHCPDETRPLSFSFSSSGRLRLIDFRNCLSILALYSPLIVSLVKILNKHNSYSPFTKKNHEATSIAEYETTLVGCFTA